MNDYQKRLTDPRWQRRRLERLEAAKWRCMDCGDARSELHVHHDWYSSGREPWNYPDSALIVVCHVCHEIRHGRRHASDRHIRIQLPREPLRPEARQLQQVDEELKHLFQAGPLTPEQCARAQQLQAMRRSLKEAFVA